MKTSLILFYTILIIYRASVGSYIASARLAIQRLLSIWSVCVPYGTAIHNVLEFVSGYELLPEFPPEFAPAIL